MMAEDYCFRIGGLLVGFFKHAAVAGMNAESIEKTGGDHGAFDLDRLVIAGQIEKRIAAAPGAVGLEGAVLGAIVEKVGGRDGAVIAQRTVSPRPDESRRILEGKRAKEHGVHATEDSGIGADA